MNQDRPRFPDRSAAGEALARQLLGLSLPRPVTVLALPRGGVPVAVPIARAFNAPIDLVLVRKVGAPGQPELAVAAVAEGDPPKVVLDEALCRAVGADAGYVEAQTHRALQEIARRRQVYLGGRARLGLDGRTAIVVDDGMATGSTMRAALEAVRLRRPGWLVLALPVAPRESLQAMRGLVDQTVCLSQPSPFFSVGEHYVDFRQVDDDEVLRALEAVEIKPSGAAQ